MTDRISRRPLTQLFRPAAPEPPPAPAAPALDEQPAATSTEPSAASAVDDNEIERTLDASSDPQQLAQLVLTGSPLRMRQLAAQRVTGREQLSHLLKQLQGKDKSVYRILKDKRDALRAEEKQAAQLDEELRTLCAALESLAARIYDLHYEPAVEHYEALWRSLEAQAPPAIRDRAWLAIDRCHGIIGAQRQQRAAQAAQVAEQAAREAQRRAARAASEARVAEEAKRQQAAATLAAAEAETQRAAEEQLAEERRTAEARALRQLGAMLARAHAALQAGRTGPAAAIHRALAARLPAAPSLPPPLARSLHDLEAKLGALREWKDYAAAPKRAELILEMEALIGSTESPKALAERIRALRTEWKTVSQGVVTDSEADWQRFNQAAASAYEPCRKHFEELARQRAENLERRRHVLTRLQSFEAGQAGEQPDWRSIDVVLREAPEEWRRTGPVSRDAVRELQELFDASLTRLRQRLEGWQSQNAAEKQALIQRAQELLGQEDNRAATEAVKALQRHWQELGPAPRQLEYRLWQDFRGHCDAVFRKREQLRTEYVTNLAGNRARALELCEQVERAAAQAGPALLEATRSIPQWRASFDAAGELPRADQRELYGRFEQALKQIAAGAARQRAHDAAQSFDNLLAAARHIQSFGWAVAQGQDAAERDALMQAAEAFIAGISHWPKGAEPALKQCWEAARNGPAQDPTAHEAALRMLCIRSEVHGDRPTPPADQALRKSYQLQRLVKSMGRREEEAPGDWETLALEWVRVGPVTPALYDALCARFVSSRGKSG